jgi:uncharacterized membrane protein required for colicin V production
MNVGSIILDVILVLIVLFVAWRSAKRGFVRTLIEMVGYVLAIVLAFSVASFLSKQIYESFVRPSIVKSIEANLSEFNGENLSQVFNKVKNNIPSYMLTAAGYNAEIEKNIADEIMVSKGNTAKAAADITDRLAKPAMTYILNIILIFILFFLFMLVVRFLAKVLNSLFNVPVLGTVNYLLGGVLGIFKGVIIALLLCALISISIKLFGDKWFITNDIVNNTYLYKYVSQLYIPFIPK